MSFKNRVRLFTILLAVLYFIFGSWISVESGDSSLFLIKRGMSLKETSDLLKSQGRIRTSFILYHSLKLFGVQKKLKSGQYRLTGRESIVNYYSLFTEGRYETKSITIPEGYSNRKIAKLLSGYGLDSAKFLSIQSDPILLEKFSIPATTTEGYLLPNTYEVNYDMSEYDLTVLLLGENKKIWSDSLEQEMKKRNLTKLKVLTMASIIEGEANLDNEMPRISGVYWNRIQKGIPLGADPTIQYLLPDAPRRLLYKDLEIKSPYNTYRNKGLPPGPIGNPGVKSILAALYPEKNNYLYFVADGKGGHVFTKTLIEHNQAKEKYDQIMKPRRLEQKQKKAQVSNKGKENA